MILYCWMNMRSDFYKYNWQWNMRVNLSLPKPLMQFFSLGFSDTWKVHLGEQKALTWFELFNPPEAIFGHPFEETEFFASLDGSQMSSETHNFSTKNTRYKPSDYFLFFLEVFRNFPSTNIIGFTEKISSLWFFRSKALRLNFFLFLIHPFWNLFFFFNCWK